MSDSHTEQNRKTIASAILIQHTELVVIWVHPPGGPGWGGARDLDFLIKESIMRIRNRPSDNPMMLLRRRKQNEETLGGKPVMSHNRDALAKDLPARCFPFRCSSVVRGQTRTSIVRIRESRGVQYPHLYRGGVEHDADHGTEGLGGEVVLELCADNAGVACRW